ncbi:uncharacterized protein LOC115343224 [Aquila chrysaetos chrysaetos]|uniref:uncharacterized protein LOC115343224 n=1 Tax=Aquila chrysaetos chrysaetos TaxID=223781 RepID=UPI001176E50D|nr:uncharacterized protein LOC115343224 [Aquila chrysaetos chrysaetos]
MISVHNFDTIPVIGQWRNDVFDERGAIVNCSGDICDGLWINGYPAAILDLHWLIYQSLREIQPESGSDTLCGAGDASSSQHECFNMDESHSHEKNLWLTEVTMQRKKKGGKKPSGRISAEKAEKMTVLQEKMEDSRSHMTSKEYKLQKDQHFTKNSETLQANIMEPGCENTDDLCPAKFLTAKVLLS